MVVLDMEPVPGTFGVKWEFTQSVAGQPPHTFTPTVNLL